MRKDSQVGWTLEFYHFRIADSATDM